MIKLVIYPLRYGKDNLVEAFMTGECGCELEISTETSVQRSILTIEQTMDLKRQIESALLSYDEFKRHYAEAQ